MPINFSCIEPNCSKDFNVSEQNIGRKTNCPQCGNVVIIPTQTVAACQKLFIDTHGREMANYRYLMGFGITRKRIDLMEWLLRQRPDIDINAGDNITTKASGTFMNAAAAMPDSVEMMQLLKDRGAGVNTQNSNGDKPIHYAAMYGNFEVIKWLVRKNVVNVNEPGQAGRTPIHCAAEYGRLQCLKSLVDELPVNILIRNDDDLSVMHFAAGEGHIDCMEYLASLESGLVEASGASGMTPMHSAALSGQVASIECLKILGASVNAINVQGITPIHLAALKGQIAGMKCLKRLEANIDYPVAANGFTAIFFAAASGQIPSLQCLKDLRARFDVRSTEGLTVLDIAVRAGQTEAAEWLRRNGVR